MKLLKSFYYLRSAAALLAPPSNLGSLFSLALGRGGLLRFAEDIELNLLRPLDALIAKETIIDDHYRLRTLQEPSFIVDAGGSVGDFAIYAARLFPQARITSFEPDKRYFEVLCENLKRNRANNVRALNSSLGSRSGSLRLGEFIDAPVDLLKIDCEGAELEILEGIGDGNFQMIRSLAIEYHNFIVEGQDRQLVEFLNARGFSCTVHADYYDSRMGYIFAVRGD